MVSDNVAVSEGHTPGPWVAEKLSSDARPNERPWVGNRMGQYAALSCGDTQEEAVANARLIAAAPDMYDALLPVINLEMWTESADDSEIVLMTVGTVRKMRAAIARTKTGEGE